MRCNIETFSGDYFDYDDPPTDLCLVDIAVPLANICRFGGHVEDFYSVAAHSLLVADLVEAGGGSPQLVLAALHHDSHEAFIGDVPTPLKRKMGLAYANLRNEIDAGIAEWLGISPNAFHHPAIVEADALALRMEACELKRSKGVGPHWGDHRVPVFGLEPPPRDRAADWFIDAHNRLKKAAA